MKHYFFNHIYNCKSFKKVTFFLNIIAHNWEYFEPVENRKRIDSYKDTIQFDSKLLNLQNKNVKVQN